MSEKKTVEHVKVLFDIVNDDGSIDVESVSEVLTATGPRIDNILIWVFEVTTQVEVIAEPAPDGLLHFVELRSPAGHSTVRLWFADASNVLPVRDCLRKMGCSSELDLSRLVAVDIPPSVPYSRIRVYLDLQEAAGIFEYEEACLGQS